MAQGITVFISHAREDETVALALKDFLECIFLNGDFFVSGTDLGGGDVWIEELRSKLDSATAIIALVTPYSKENKWVYFEAGAGFAKRKTIPLLADGMTFQLLPPPLSLLQGRFFDRSGLEALVCDVSALAGLRKPVRFSGIDDALRIVEEFILNRRKDSCLSAPPTVPLSVETLAPSKVVDPELSDELEKLKKAIHWSLRTAIQQSGTAFDVPTAREMESLQIVDLYTIAEQIGLPVQIMILNVEFVRAPLVNDANWKKQNVVSSLERIRSALDQFDAALKRAGNV